MQTSLISGQTEPRHTRTQKATEGRIVLILLAKLIVAPPHPTPPSHIGWLFCLFLPFNIKFRRI